VVTADRPPDLIGTGANQTIQQSQMFGQAVSLYLECPLPTQPNDAETWFSRSRDAAEFATLNMTSVQLEAPL
jgi:2-succinyl-5-enolpyruvyl-6-hydroxy-3-cyclohexene-1-carboxylate synthase